MSMNEISPGRYDGEWWLPEDKEARVPGTLVVDDDGGSKLHLIGALGSEFRGMTPEKADDGSVSYTVTEKSLSESGVYDRILGEVGASGFTLDDCFRVHRSGLLFGGRATERISVHRAFGNVHFEQGEALGFTAIVARFHRLPFWVARSGIKEFWDVIENSDSHVESKSHRLEAQVLDTETFAGVDGATVTLEHEYSFEGDEVTARGFKQDFQFRVKYPNLKDLTELLAQVSALQDLVTIGLGRSAAFSRITLRHPDIVRELQGSEKQWPMPVPMTARWVVQPDEKNLRSHEVVFTLEDLGSLDVVSAWMLEAQKNRSALSRVMSTRYSESMYSNDSLMNCAAAIEAYDRDKHNDDIYYIERIKRCIAHVGETFATLVWDTDKWAKDVKNNRNTVAHHLATIEGASTEQIMLGRSAFWLFVLCLLKDSGAPQAVFDKIAAHGSFRWLRSQLEPLMVAP